MKLKNRIMVIASGIVVIVMLISTISVSVLITKQNRQQAHNHLERSFRIINDRIAAIQAELRNSVEQMTTVDDMGSKIEFIAGEKDSDAIGMFQNSFVEIVDSLYNIALTGKVNQVSAYDQDGDLVAFVNLYPDRTVMGFPRYGAGPEGALRLAEVTTGDKPATPPSI